MKKFLTIIGLAAVSLAGITGANAQFTAGNLIVSRVGNGVDTLGNSGGGISLLQYTNNGTLVDTTVVSTFSGGTPTGIQWSGTATSEGAISLSQNKTSLTIVGYVPPFTGSGSLASRTDAQAPRGFLTVDYNQNISGTTLIGAYSSNNIRSGVAFSSGTYFAGGNNGTIYRDTSNTTIQSAVTNTRVVNIFNGNLYFSTGSGSQGIYGWTGTPTTATSASAVIVGVSGQGTNPYDFVFNDLNTIAYIADSAVGVQKFTWSGSAWTHAYNITTSTAGLTGLAVDFSGTNPIIYAVNPGNLWKYEDTGVGSMTSIATAGTNYAFRGLEFAPIPEPATFALLGAAAGLTIIFRRRRKA